MDGGRMPLPTRPQRYCDPASLVLDADTGKDTDIITQETYVRICDVPHIYLLPFRGGTEGLSVVVGALNIKTGSTASKQRLQVAKVFIHPGYVAFSHKNDIALIKLSSSAKLDDHVSPAYLPTKSQ